MMTDDRQETQQHTSLPNPVNAGREGQIRIARAMQRAGHVYQALHTLDGLLADYPRTAESRAAAEALAAIAEDLEHRGRVYTALGLYKRLEQLS